MQDMDKIEPAITRAMQQKDMDPLIIEEFKRRVRLVHKGETGKIPAAHIDNLDPQSTALLENLTADASKGDWDRLVQIKLNGGLGTSMGLTAAKTLIKIKDGLSFLEIILRQTEYIRNQEDCDLPLLLMNSFNTQSDSLAVAGVPNINDHARGALPPDFLQNMIPRIDQTSLMPLEPYDDDQNWCPPGHGDIFLALRITGILDKLINAGYTTAFISNGDNLGATPDPKILNYFHDHKLEWASEVTKKTKADLKGGILFSNKQTQRTELLETAQVEDDFIENFQNTAEFPYFNINNLWVDLRALKKKLEKGQLDLSLIVNPKEVQNTAVYQLETAMGAAIGNFENSRVIVVPRSRFAPVKNCADLLVRKSDIYILDKKTCHLTKNPARKLGEPLVILDDNYKSIQNFERLFPLIPSLLDLAELHISGKVLFDQPVDLAGKVSLENTAANSISIGDFIKKAGTSKFRDISIKL